MKWRLCPVSPRFFPCLRLGMSGRGQRLCGRSASCIPSDGALQTSQPLPQLGIIDLAILASRLNFLEHLADGIDHAQQRGRALGIERELPVS